MVSFSFFSREYCLSTLEENSSMTCLWFSMPASSRILFKSEYLHAHDIVGFDGLHLALLKQLFPVEGLLLHDLDCQELDDPRPLLEVLEVILEFIGDLQRLFVVQLFERLYDLHAVPDEPHHLLFDLRVAQLYERTVQPFLFLHVEIHRQLPDLLIS